MYFDNIKVGQQVILGARWDYREALVQPRIGTVVSVTEHRFVYEFPGYSNTTCNKNDGSKRGYHGHSSALCMNTPESIALLHENRRIEVEYRTRQDLRIERAKQLTQNLREANVPFADVNGYGASYSFRLLSLTDEQMEKLVTLLIANKL